ncbi:MAG TPA: hypothetical protein VLW85_15740 [Myxococcales bacterium]|nr:hypothetical protein [Myxococcales bacterium]
MTTILLLAIALGPSGVNQKRIDTVTGQRVSFENADQRPHQLYSPDCASMASPVMKPGESFSFVAPMGPRSCHFEDLLDPASEQYQGEVNVKPSQQEDAQAALSHVAG